MSHQLLFIDFEFTMPESDQKRKGFIPEIIEIGLVSVLNHQVIQTFTSYVKPVINPILTEFCTSFLNISQTDVDQGISFSQLIDQINSVIIDENIAVVTWGNMDMRVLRDSCRTFSISYPFKAKEVDLSLEYKRFYGDHNQSGLIKALLEYGHSAQGKHHRALDDALTTYEIYKLVEKDKKHLNKAEPACIGDLIDLSKLFGKIAE